LFVFLELQNYSFKLVKRYTFLAFFLLDSCILYLLSFCDPFRSTNNKHPLLLLLISQLGGIQTAVVLSQKAVKQEHGASDLGHVPE